MTSASDITAMLTSDGREWGKYISDKLKGFPQVTSDSLVLDNQDYENAPEVTSACRQSAVVLLLATPQLLDYMREKAGWFSKSLQEVPTTSSVVVVLLLDKKDIDDVTEDHYVTSDWTYLDPGYTVEETGQVIARVLDIVENCRPAKEKEGAEGSPSLPPPPQTKHKSPEVLVELFPSTVYESGSLVAMVFKEEIKGNVTLKVEQTDLQLTTKRENATVFTFSAPRLAPGKYTLRVFKDNKRLHCRPKLTFHRVEMSAFTSPHYLMQALELRDLSELDLRLKDAFNDSLPSDRGLDNVFQKLPSPDLAERQKNSDTQYPTILHYAAAHGLSEFCAALLEFPVSSRAFRIRNSDGLDPAELAAERGFDELENYIIDFMEMQDANDYIAMNLGPLGQGESPSDDYVYLPLCPRPRAQSESSITEPEPRTEERGTDRPFSVDSESDIHAGRLDRPPKPPPRSKKTELARVRSERYGSSASVLQTVPESHHKSCTLPAGSGLDAKAFMGMGASDNETEQARAMSERYGSPASVLQTVPESHHKSCTLPAGSALDAKAFMGMGASENETEQARAMSERYGSPASVLQTVPESNPLSRTLPAGSALDAEVFMGMGASDNVIKQPLPEGAVGCRSQSELIEVQEMVKTGKINLNEAQMLYNAWMHRYGRNTAASFRERKKELTKIKEEYMLVREKQKKEASRSKSFLSRFWIGGRQTQPSIKLKISEPVLQRPPKKSTKVYIKSASTSHLPLSTAERDSTASTASSSSSSRDSGLSQASRESTMSDTSYGPEEGVEREDEEEPDLRDSKRSRKVSDTSSTHRLSLGRLYLQQEEKAKDSAEPPPPLPPRNQGPPLPLRKAGSGSLHGGTGNPGVKP